MPDSSDSLSRTGEALARHLLSVLPPEQPYGRADLARLPLPVAHYLGGVLDRRLAREAALPASAWFDGEAEPVREAARAWRTATHDTARFPADEWADAAHDAARRVLGYLVMPVETLAERVFADDEEPLPAEAVRARMALFSPYPYLREIAEGYFARKGIEEIGRDDFERLLRRIDRRMVSQLAAQEWLALLAPLFGLLRPLPDGGRVPAPLLRSFFEAKGYDDLAHTLGTDAYDEPALRVALADALPDLDEAGDGAPEVEAAPAPERAEAAEPDHAEPPPRDALGPEAAEEPSDVSAPAAPTPVRAAEEARAGAGSVASGSVATASSDPAEARTGPAASKAMDAPDEREAPEEPDTPPSAPPSPSGPQPVAREVQAPESEASDEPTRADGPEPLWVRLARQHKAPPAPSAPSPPSPAPTPESGKDPLWKRFAGGTPELSAERRAEPLVRLETRVLGPSATERRAWYVANLTGGSESEYRAILEQLDASPNWTEASQVIAREVFRKHLVNIYSDAAVAFTDAVEARFERRR